MTYREKLWGLRLILAVKRNGQGTHHRSSVRRGTEKFVRCHRNMHHRHLVIGDLPSRDRVRRWHSPKLLGRPSIYSFTKKTPAKPPQPRQKPPAMPKTTSNAKISHLANCKGGSTPLVTHDSGRTLDLSSSDGCHFCSVLRPSSALRLCRDLLHPRERGETFQGERAPRELAVGQSQVQVPGSDSEAVEK